VRSAKHECPYRNADFRPSDAAPGRMFPEEGWVRDVSQVIAAKVRDVAWRDGQGLTGGTPRFIEAHSDPADQQQVLPLWH